MKDGLKDILAVIGAGEIEILNYELNAKDTFEVPFAAEGDSRVFTTFVTLTGVASAAYALEKVDDIDVVGERVFVNGRWYSFEYWYNELCDDREPLFHSAILWQIERAKKRSETIQLLCPSYTEFLAMCWIEKLVVWEFWAKRVSRLKQGHYIRDLLKVISDLKPTNAAWKIGSFQKFYKEALMSDDEAVKGRVFWLAPKTTNEFIVTTIEKIAV